MKIIIVGAGRIGRSLARLLSAEDYEVYLIEQNEEIVQRFSDKIDAKLILGSGADPDILKQVRVQEADLVLAVTTSDETNLVVCSIAAILGAKRRIARVRNVALSNMLSNYGHNQFFIDEMINPELVAAQSIVKAIQSPGASEVADFANGRLMLRGFDISEESPLCGVKLEDLKDEDFPWPFLIVSIVRDGTLIIAKGDSTIKPNDHIYVLLPKGSLAEFLTYIAPDIRMPQKIVIYGATITGINVADSLVKKIREVILIEDDASLAEAAAADHEGIRVINGSPSEAEILSEAGIEAVDAFIAASHNDNANLISSALAKKMGAKATIITTQQADYVNLGNALNIDTIINPQTLAVEQILKLVRGHGISSVIKFLDCEAEVVEFRAAEGSPITKNELKVISIGRDAIIGAVYSANEVRLAKGNTRVKPGEHVIVFCREKTVKKLQDLFNR